MDPALLLLAGLAVILLLQFRRARTQQRRVRETQDGLEVGRRVLTAAGMIGTVVEIGDEEVTLASETGDHTLWVRTAVVRVLPETVEATGSTGTPEPDPND